MSAKNTKGVRKLERPRPLRLNSDPEKSPSSVLSPSESVTMLIDTNAQCAVTDEDVLKEIEMLHISVNNGNYDATILPLIANVCDLLKLKGASMESSFKDQLDCYFVTLRNASREERLDVVGRLRLLEVIELRAMGWKCNQNLTEYYKRTFAELEGHEFSTYNSSSNQMAFLPQLQVQPQQQQHTMTPIAPATSPPLSLQPTEVLKSSGKFGKPAKIPGRNFLKDEIVIRNSDSGKVNPGVRDRLVQITGPSEETITRAKELIEDTIRRNASPVREMGDETSNYNMGTKESCQKPSLVHSYSMGDASMGEYTSTITVGRDVLRISGAKAVLIKTAKLVLDKYFSGQAEFSDKVPDGLSPSNQGSYMSPEPGVLSNNRGTTDLCTETASWQGLAVRRHSGPPSSQTSSSSDEETYKEDGEQELMEKAPTQSPKHVSRSGSIVKNLPAQIATKASGIVEAPAQTKQFKRSGSSPEFSAKADRPQVPSTASLDSSDLPDDAQSNRRMYSREFLLECSQSSVATQMPPDFPSLDPEVANLMVKQEKAPTQSPKHVSRSGSIMKNLPAQIATKASGIVEAPAQTKQFKRSGSSPEFSAKADRPQVPSTALLDSSDLPDDAQSNRRMYSREFLLECSQSSVATQMPPDFPSLDPEVANLMVKQEKAPTQSPKHVSRSGSIMKNLPAQIATKASGIVEAPAQTKQFKRSGSSPEFSAKADRPQVPSTALLDSSDLPDDAQSNRRMYSREFLLECSQSSVATQMPPDFPSLDPEVANLMVKQEKAPTQSPKHVSRSGSIMKNLPAQIATKVSGIVEAPAQTKQFKRSGSSPEFSAKADRPQVPSTASLDSSDLPDDAQSNRRMYSREFLLECSQSSVATQMPPDFPSLDPEVANLMVKQHITPFDSDGFRQRMMRQASVSDFVSSSPVSSTPPRLDLSEVEDSSTT
ncbi:uncharacterized protein LOC144113544 isoform X3 [Amblyomma americanum]